MKKALKRMLALLMVVPLLVGCTMKTDYGFNISSDKNVKLEYTIAYDKEFLQGLASMSNMGDENAETKELTDEELWAALDKSLKDDSTATEEGLTKTKYKKEGWYGYVFSKDLGSIEDLTTTSSTEKSNILSDDFLDKPLFIKDGNKYKSNITIKDESGSMSSMQQAQASGAVFELTLTIKLPNEPISSNAASTSSDGTELTWKLTEAKDVEFEFEFDGSSKAKTDKKDKKDKKSDSEETSKTIIFAAIGGAILLALIIVIVVVIAASKNKKSQPVDPNQQ